MIQDFVRNFLQIKGSSSHEVFPQLPGREHFRNAIDTPVNGLLGLPSATRFTTDLVPYCGLCPDPGLLAVGTSIPQSPASELVLAKT
jgi:hypothetical protein